MIKCSFCDKSQREVRKMVKSGRGFSICDECLVVSFAKMIESPVMFVKPDPPDTKPDAPVGEARLCGEPNLVKGGEPCKLPADHLPEPHQWSMPLPPGGLEL